MKASIVYRVAAALLLLFAASHTWGFQQTDPAGEVGALVGSMQSIHFDLLGSSRSYWDLFLGAGYAGGIFYVFAAALAWQLGGLPAATRAQLRVTGWAFALCFAAVTAVSCIYLFIIPIAFAGLITLCLATAAWLSAKEASG